MTRITKRKTIGALTALAISAAAAGVSANPAAAGVGNFCVAAQLTSVPPFIIDHCTGANHSLTSTRVRTYYGGSQQIGAAAGSSSTSIYGTYITGPGYACHPYSGRNYLVPWVGWFENGSGYVTGAEYYGVDRYC